MSPLTSAERARRARYADKLNRALDKIESLLGEMPHDFDIRRIEALHDVNLIRMLEVILQRPAEFELRDSHINLSFNIPVDRHFIDELQRWDVPDNVDPGYHAYNQWMLSEYEGRQYEKGMSRGAFCEKHLMAKMTNPRWAWVGVREPSPAVEGALFLFIWEHDCDFSDLSPPPIKLFQSKVETQKGKRRHPGHRDALEKIQRVLDGELKPYVVWQQAKDPQSQEPILAGIQMEFASACELEIDTEGDWVAHIGDLIAIENLKNPSGLVGK